MNTNSPYYGMQSDDGHYWWDGDQWQSNPPPLPVPPKQWSWAKTIAIGVGVFLALLVSIGVAATLFGGEEQQPASSSGSNWPPNPNSGSDSLDSDLDLAAMELAWSEMSYSDRQSICDGWNMPGLQQTLLDRFLEGAAESGNPVDRYDAQRFFDQKC